MNFLTNLNLSQYQIQNVLIHPLAIAPAGVQSQIYYNINDDLLYVHNGTAWVTVGSKPTAFAWTSGTTAGPTGSLTGIGMDPVAYGPIPTATGSASGIVTISAQTFAGDKTFNNKIFTLESFAFKSGVNTLTLSAAAVSGANVITVPDATGTLALVSDLHARSHAMTSSSDHTAGNWKLFYSNGTGVVTELGFGASGTVLSSGGATAAPSWVASHPTYTYTTPTDGVGTVLSAVDFISTLTVTNGHVTGGTKRNLLAGTNITITAKADGDVEIASSYIDTKYSVSAVDGADAYSHKIRLTGSDAITDDVTLAVGALDTVYGLTITRSSDTITFSHANTSSVANITSATNSFVVSQSYDTYGHVTAVTRASVDFTVAANYAFQNFAIGVDSGYTWGIVNTNTTQAAESNSDTLTFVVGTGISLFTSTVAGTDAIKIQHADTSSQASVDNSGRTYIQDVTLDEFGHVTGLVSATETVTDTHWTANLYVGATGTAANGVTTNTNTYIKFYENSVERNAFNIKGTGATTVVSDANGHITINSTNTNTTYTHKVSSQTGGAGIDLDGSDSTSDIVTIKGTTGITVTPTDANIITISGHVQNTDTGTSSSTFSIDMDDANNGVLLSASDKVLTLRNTTNTEYASLVVKDLTVQGTQTIINSNEVNIGDNTILLNADITTNAGNSGGGLAIKRLMVDNITRKDALIEYNNTINRWETTFGAVAGTLVTLPIANKYTTTLGDGTKTSFTVTHNLGTRDIVATIRETGNDYEVVYTDILVTTDNTLTVLFGAAPASAQYTITIVG